MTGHDAHLIAGRPAVVPSQGGRRLAIARGPRLPRWLRQPRHGGGACWRRNTLGSAPQPKKSRVARVALLVPAEPPPRVRGARTVRHRRDLHADVVLGALLARASHHRATRGRGWMRREQLAELVFAERAVKPVAALEEHVVLAQRERDRVDRDHGADPERARPRLPAE